MNGCKIGLPSQRPSAMAEHRRALRRRILKPGTIALKNGGGFSCIVRNVSSAGACLEVGEPFGIPDDFILVIESDHAQRPCHVAWRREKRIGVVFD